MKNTKFEKFPSVEIKGHTCHLGWQDIVEELSSSLKKIKSARKILTVEIYPGAFEEQIERELLSRLPVGRVLRSREAFKSEGQIRDMVRRDLGDDPVFGRLSYLRIDDYFDHEKKQSIQRQIEQTTDGLILVIGCGAVRLAAPDLLVYADMARWEIQQRQRANEVANLGVTNFSDHPALKYKWAFFVDWRVADRLKRQLMDDWDFVLDTNDRDQPKMISGQALRNSLQQACRQPFELKPFFDPGPWGGQWMKEVCDLDRSADNYAWCFNCVPEENSLLLKFADTLFEIPSINLVFYQPRQLLGEQVFARFGAEFPIRFDFLDTMDGGNLSLQVHPLTDYIQNQFGWHYTQDESYYLMDAGPGAKVYLGLQDRVNRDKMIADLQAAQNGGQPFPADNYAASWPVKKHDHVLIPGGTVHCSGKDCMVLEISSTPYIFTFKLWDWGRLGLDGRPRPIHINHGKEVIQFDRVPEWTRRNLINRFETVASADGWREERTGLHQLEFIETRRFWFRKAVEHDTAGTVHVLNLVEGQEITVDSPEGAFEPLTVHYAETFVVPAVVGRYRTRPSGPSAGQECAIIKAFVRSQVNCG